MNPVIELLHKRRATRAISDESLDSESIQQLQEAIRLTPSCYNKQPWRYLFITSEQAHEKASEAFTGGNAAWAPRAPLLVVAYAVEGEACPAPEKGGDYHRFDAGLATMNLMLAATHLGLVARPMAGFDPDVLRSAFDFGEKDDILCMLAIGHPGESEEHVPEKYKGIEDRPRTRKPAEEIIRNL